MLSVLLILMLMMLLCTLCDVVSVWKMLELTLEFLFLLSRIGVLELSLGSVHILHNQFLAYFRLPPPTRNQA